MRFLFVIFFFHLFKFLAIIYEVPYWFTKSALHMTTIWSNWIFSWSFIIYVRGLIPSFWSAVSWWSASMWRAMGRSASPSIINTSFISCIKCSMCWIYCTMPSFWSFKRIYLIILFLTLLVAIWEDSLHYTYNIFRTGWLFHLGLN